MRASSGRPGGVIQVPFQEGRRDVLSSRTHRWTASTSTRRTGAHPRPVFRDVRDGSPRASRDVAADRRRTRADGRGRRGRSWRDRSRGGGSRRRLLVPEGLRPVPRVSVGRRMSGRPDVDEHRRRKLGADDRVGLGLCAHSPWARPRRCSADVLRGIHGDERPPCFSHSSAVSDEPPSPLLGAGGCASALSAGVAGALGAGGREPPQATSNSRTDETARRELMTLT